MFPTQIISLGVFLTSAPARRWLPIVCSQREHTMGRRSMADFSMEFWTLVEETGWKEKVLRGAFLNGINERITRELAIGLVFSKSTVTPTPLSHDCGIDLLPGASLPTSRLYSVSKPERKAIERYITDSLASSIIRLSTSPLRTGFFFVEKNPAMRIKSFRTSFHLSQTAVPVVISSAAGL